MRDFLIALNGQCNELAPNEKHILKKLYVHVLN
jgi:hypothetical protein